jgi:hypothetical protein
MKKHYLRIQHFSKYKLTELYNLIIYIYETMILVLAKIFLITI